MTCEGDYENDDEDGVLDEDDGGGGEDFDEDHGNGDPEVGISQD